MTPEIKQRKHHHEEKEQIESSLDGVSSFTSVSGEAASADLPQQGLEHNQGAPLPVPKNLRSTVDFPGVKTVNAAQAEKEKLITAANLAADTAKEDALKAAAKKREEMLAAAMSEAEKERKAIVEKAKKEALAFKSKKMSSVPRVAGAVFSKVFSDLF
jgi:vacuolar-type H+-ATPase subunit H